MSNRIRELLVILLVLIITFLTAAFSCLSDAINPKSAGSNYAQILTEILGIIFVLPQVIIQLTLKPQRKDIGEVFAGSVPFYFAYYILSIILLSSEYFYVFLSNNKIANILIQFMFLSSIILIFPYLYFLIKEHSTSKTIFDFKRRRIFKYIKKLVKLNASNNEKSILKISNNLIGNYEEEIIKLVNEFKDVILTYGKDDYKLFSNGIDKLAELIEASYFLQNPSIDNLLIEILEIIKEIGIKIDIDAQKSLINERFFKTAENILLSKEDEKRVSFLVTKILSIIEIIITDGSVTGSSETTRKAISTVNRLALIGLRQSPAIKLEYHLLAENLRKFCIFSIHKLYENCARDILEDLGYIVELSLKYLSIDELPIFKICDALTEIGVLSSKKRNEVITIQAVNRMVSIITSLKERKVLIDLNICMANLLELIAYVWVNFEEMEVWLTNRLNYMKADSKIDFKKYLKPAKKILRSKSLVSEAIFNDFIDQINNVQHAV